MRTGLNVYELRARSRFWERVAGLWITGRRRRMIMMRLGVFLCRTPSHDLFKPARLSRFSPVPLGTIWTGLPLLGSRSRRRRSVLSFNSKLPSHLIGGLGFKDIEFADEEHLRRSIDSFRPPCTSAERVSLGCCRRLRLFHRW
jgi:hypothetical protein